MSVRLLQGDCREVLLYLPGGSVQTCVTSPPYYGLRDYGTGHWEGGDPACDHRSPTMRGGREESRPKLAGSVATNMAQLINAQHARCGRCGAVKVDQQIGLEKTGEEFIAEMVAVFREVRRVLRDDGTLWLNLGDSYATSPNGRSAADTKAAGNDDRTFRDKPFSTIGSWGAKSKDLLGIPWRVAFALQADGWYLRQDIIWHKPNPMPESIRDRCTKAHEYLFLLSKSERYFFDTEAMKEPAAFPQGSGNTRKSKYVAAAETSSTMRTKADLADIGPRETRNRRSVWTIPTKPFKEAHFATFPPALIEPCILAGSRPGDTVLDPFNGAGTTGLVAMQHGRSYTGIDLNPGYLAISRRRLGLNALEDLLA